MSSSNVLREGLITVNSYPTHVVALGSWIEDPFPKDDAQPIILVIPGNPGVITFYKDFMAALYEQLGGKISVWGISHAGHDSFGGIADNAELGLEDQISHKIEFIKTYIPENRKLILIGHSIGCYIALDILRSAPSIKVHYAYLMFPTIERMINTPNGKYISNVLKYLRLPILLIIYLLGYFSDSWKRRIISFFQPRNLPECAMQAMVYFCTNNCVRSSMAMTRDEFEIVRDLNVYNLTTHIDKLTFFYGTSDGWCPISFYEEMKKRFPDGDVQLCNQNIAHAFVLKSSLEVALLISDSLREKDLVPIDKS